MVKVIAFNTLQWYTLTSVWGTKLLIKKMKYTFSLPSHIYVMTVPWTSNKVRALTMGWRGNVDFAEGWIENEPHGHVQTIFDPPR